jgi:hypothetical protein
MLYETQVTIAVTGTAVPLSPAGTRAAATWVQVQGLAANNAAGGTLGGSDVTNTSGTKRGVVIAPSGTQFLPYCGKPSAYDLQTIYVNGTAGDKFDVLYFRS